MNDSIPSFDVFFDLDHEQGRRGVGLPKPFRDFYGGDLVLPLSLDDRAVASVNFVVRRDGVVSIPGRSGGAVIRGNNSSDRPLMALLRAAHDAVLVGSETLAMESRHIWTPGHIYAPWGEALTHWRMERDVPPYPLNVIVSRSGTVADSADPAARKPLSLDHPVFVQQDVPVLVITTQAGEHHFEGLRSHTNHSVLAIESDDFETEILRQLKTRNNISHLLVEGGPTINGAFHAKRLISDDFLTLAPGMAGRTWGSRRATLMMGHEFAADAIPEPTLISVRRSGSHLMIRERYRAKT
jgi:riboflavin biosynthesis pyrimidine reductase